MIRKWYQNIWIWVLLGCSDVNRDVFGCFNQLGWKKKLLWMNCDSIKRTKIESTCLQSISFALTTWLLVYKWFSNKAMQTKSILIQSYFTENLFAIRQSWSVCFCKLESMFTIHYSIALLDRWKSIFKVAFRLINSWGSQWKSFGESFIWMA